MAFLEELIIVKDYNRHMLIPLHTISNLVVDNRDSGALKVVLNNGQSIGVSDSLEELLTKIQDVEQKLAKKETTTIQDIVNQIDLSSEFTDDEEVHQDDPE